MVHKWSMMPVFTWDTSCSVPSRRLKQRLVHIPLCQVQLHWIQIYSTSYSLSCGKSCSTETECVHLLQQKQLQCSFKVNFCEPEAAVWSDLVLKGLITHLIITLGWRHPLTEATSQYMGNILRQNRWCILPVNINSRTRGCWWCCRGNKTILCVCVCSRSPTERKCITAASWPHLGNRQSLFPPLLVPPCGHTHARSHTKELTNVY